MEYQSAAARPVLHLYSVSQCCHTTLLLVASFLKWQRNIAAKIQMYYSLHRSFKGSQHVVTPPYSSSVPSLQDCLQNTKVLQRAL